MLINVGENNIQSLIKENGDYDETLKGIDDLVAKANSFQKQYGSLSDETKAELKIMVPDTVDSIKLLSELTNLADKAGIPLETIGIKDDNQGEYSIGFSVQTTYTKFKQFITYWEKSMRLLTLQSVAFSPGKTDEDTIKFNVSLSTYYLNAKKK